MAQGTTIQVIGAEELSDGLQRAALDLQGMRTVNEAVGSMVARVAAGLAPHHTGALAGSIRATVLASGVEVNSGLVYAGPIHWGWPARNIAAQPFLASALSQSQLAIEALYVTEVDNVLERVGGA